MREKIKFPVYVCEVETGEIELYYDINELRLIGIEKRNDKSLADITGVLKNG